MKISCPHDLGHSSGRREPLLPASPFRASKIILKSLLITYSSTYVEKAYFSLGSAPVAPPIVPIASNSRPFRSWAARSRTQRTCGRIKLGVRGHLKLIDERSPFLDYKKVLWPKKRELSKSPLAVPALACFSPRRKLSSPGANHNPVLGGDRGMLNQVAQVYFKCYTDIRILSVHEDVTPRGVNPPLQPLLQVRLKKGNISSLLPNSPTSLPKNRQSSSPASVVGDGAERSATTIHRRCAPQLRHRQLLHR
jgi:hypothetical protein